MMKSKFVLAAVVMISGIALLAGCTSSAAPVKTHEPSPSSSSAPSGPSESHAPTISSLPTPPATMTGVPATPTSTVKPVVKTTVLDIGADALTIKNPDGTTFGTYSYTVAPTTAIAALTKVYGHAPKIVYTGEPQACSGGENIYTWDNFILEFYSTTKDPAQVKGYDVHTNGANTTYQFIVQAPNGTQVGNSFSKLIAANPSFPKQETDFQGKHYTEVLVDHSQVKEPYDTSSLGTVASGDSDIVRMIAAPAGIGEDC